MKAERKRRFFAIGWGVALTLAMSAVLLDTFVIPRQERTVVAIADEQPAGETAASQLTAGMAGSGAAAETVGSGAETNGTGNSTAGGAGVSGAAAETVGGTATAAVGETATANAANAQIDANRYQDDRVIITISTLRAQNTTYYVADIVLSDPSSLRTALAQNAYGRNLKETTSAMAGETGAILAINGDYYGFRNSGCVIRNGVVYRDQQSDADLLLIDRQGDFQTVSAGELSAGQLDSGEWWQGFSFGPTLVKDGAVNVDESAEVDQAKTSNPRTAIGQIDALHYAFVVSDGRTAESEGFTLYQLAEVMRGLGCATAYNLDGGGSSTMVFMGRVVNNPTTNGRSISEREVSDIVYIGL